MSKRFLALMLLGALMIGLHAGGAAGESCPLPASEETVQKEMKTLRTLLNEIQKDVREVLTRLGSGLNVVFEKEEFNIAKNFLIGTLPYIGKNFKITFEWFITGFGSSYQTIIHFTIRGNNEAYGDRTPGVWLVNNNELYVQSAMEPTTVKVFPFSAKKGIWMTMEISQYMDADNKFEFDFKIDGTSYWTVENTKAEAFMDVKMFSGDNYYPPLNGKIRNFQVQTTVMPSSGLNVVFEKESFKIAKNFLIGTLSYLGKKYKIRFEWFITGFGSSYQTIIHFTIGGNNEAYGDRTPGVWLVNNNQLYVQSAMEPTTVKVFPFAAKTGIWMTMEISQYMDADNKFEFDFKIDGTSYWTVENTRPEAFTDVKMFSGDNYYPPLKGKIRNFQVLTRNE